MDPRNSGEGRRRERFPSTVADEPRGRARENVWPAAPGGRRRVREVVWPVAPPCRARPTAARAGGSATRWCSPSAPRSPAAWRWSQPARSATPSTRAPRSSCAEGQSASVAIGPGLPTRCREGADLSTRSLTASPRDIGRPSGRPSPDGLWSAAQGRPATRSLTALPPTWASSGRPSPDGLWSAASMGAL